MGMGVFRRGGDVGRGQNLGVVDGADRGIDTDSGVIILFRNTLFEA